MEHKDVTTSVEGNWKLSAWEWKIESQGLIRKTLAALADGKMLGNKCPDCGLVYFLPKPFCRCMGMPEEFVEVKDTGTVSTYTFTGAWAYEGIAEEEVSGTPLIFAGIVFDGSDTMTVCNLHDVEPEAVHVGMRVKLKWPEEPTGTLNDVLHAVPL